MARTKTSTLGRKADRLALPVSKTPIFESLGGGCSVGYRRNNGAGSWVVRRFFEVDGVHKKAEKALGLADDFADADGARVLTWPQAQAAALAFDPLRAQKAAAAAAVVQVTVDTALKHYEADIGTRGGDAGNVSRLRHHLPEKLLKKAVADLTVADLKTWRDSLAKTLAAATVNRTTTPLKAALNQAADADQGQTITSRAAWDIGLKTLEGAEEARNVILSDAVVGRIVQAAYEQSPALGLLVEVLAVTGSRYSQVAALKVEDLQNGNADPRLSIPVSNKGKGAKAARSTPVPIPAALAKRLRAAAEDRAPSAPLLLKPTGGAWCKSDHYRPFAVAVAAAELKEKEIAPYSVDEITAYALRHSSIVRMALKGVPLRLVAALHDTSVTMIERTYSRDIASVADAVARGAMLDLGDAQSEATPISSRHENQGPEPVEGRCRYGHDYREFPPYKNKAGAIVCAECARERTRKARAAKRKCVLATN